MWSNPIFVITLTSGRMILVESKRPPSPVSITAISTFSFSKNQKEAIQKGTVIDWVNESRELAMLVYDSAKIDQNLSYRYMYDHFTTVKIQLRKGGLRLAKVLNELFG